MDEALVYEEIDLTDLGVPEYEKSPHSEVAQLSIFLEKLNTEKWPNKDKYLKKN